jgi:hypothetical protein
MFAINARPLEFSDYHIHYMNHRNLFFTSHFYVLYSDPKATSKIYKASSARLHVQKENTAIKQTLL